MRRTFLLLSALAVCSLAWAQKASEGGVPASDEARPSADSSSPVVTFSLDFPNSQPERYSIQVPSDGSAHYQSTGRISRESEDKDDFDFDFSVSAETRDRIFRLTKDAGYFRHDLDSHGKGLAFMGKKTLSYRNGSESTGSTFNYASNGAAHELSDLFQNLSTTLEFGHRLDFDHHYQKLALDDELKHMQEMAKGRELAEIAAIQPILEQIVADHSVMNVARARAQQLLEDIKEK